jgi:RimJ/RimL family protein N-acetyltransferase
MTRTRKESLERLRANPGAVEPGQSVTVGPFRPEDAEGVARLYFAIYGENFPLDYVYDPEQIAAANAGPDLHQFVARTPAGDVVGLTALFRVAPNPGIMESGGLMILPAYRGGTLAMRMTKASLATLPEELGLNAIFGQSVCDHLITQKLARHFSFPPYALEMEAMPPRPEGSTDGIGGRISLLSELRVYRDVPHTVHLPERFTGFLKDLYAKYGLERSFGAASPASGRTRAGVTTMDGASLAKLLVDEPGADLDETIDAFEAGHPGRHAYQLQLPLAHSGLPAAEEAARKRGYFLGGLLPLWTGTDVLLLQKLTSDPDFSLPLLLTDEARELMDCIRSDWAGLPRR